MSDRKTLIIIPAYNEEKSISAVISAIKNFSADFDILVVDDASTYSTAQLAMTAGARLLSLPFNMGYGIALQKGFKYAIRNDYGYAVQMPGHCFPAQVPL